MEEIKDQLVNVRERVADEALSLLSDAVYRGDDSAKKLERQCAKISRALDKAIHEYEVLYRLKGVEEHFD